jgi:uncharacterized membrane protein (DUF106 family)
MPYGIAKFKEAKEEINRKIKEAKRAKRKDEVERLREEKIRLNHDFEKEIDEHTFRKSRHLIVKAVIILIVMIIIYYMLRNSIFGG